MLLPLRLLPRLRGFTVLESIPGSFFPLDTAGWPADGAALPTRSFSRELLLDNHGSQYQPHHR